jgi:hypothetical protein
MKETKETTLAELEDKLKETQAVHDEYSTFCVKLHKHIHLLKEKIRIKNLEWMKDLTWLNDIKTFCYNSMYLYSLTFSFNKKESYTNKTLSRLIDVLPHHGSTTTINIPQYGDISIAREDYSNVNDGPCQYRVYTKSNKTFINLLESINSEIVVFDDYYDKIKINNIVILKSNRSKEFRKDMTEIMDFFDKENNNG